MKLPSWKWAKNLNSRSFLVSSSWLLTSTTCPYLSWWPLPLSLSALNVWLLFLVSCSNWLTWAIHHFGRGKNGGFLVGWVYCGPNLSDANYTHTTTTTITQHKLQNLRDTSMGCIVQLFMWEAWVWIPITWMRSHSALVSMALKQNQK